MYYKEYAAIVMDMMLKVKQSSTFLMYLENLVMNYKENL